VTEEIIRNQVSDLIRKECLHSGDLPDGDLATHLDSVQRLTLVVAIEDHFKVCFDPEDEEQVETLDDVIQLIQRKLTAK
jgi:acyl carrier protein